MIRIAFYGKGGIGKSTIASNISAALSQDGFKVMMIGCDPKSDCTRNLRGDREIPSVSAILKQKYESQLDIDEFIYGKEIDSDEVVFEGYNGILCVEAGGPEPGVGCAGRGIVIAIELLKRSGAFERYRPDVVIYDVLGDIVCGGFGMNLRQGMADKVVIVTSADYLSIYAANNICRGIKRYAKIGGTKLSGFIYNVRGGLDDISFVEMFAKKVGSKIIGAIPLSSKIAESEVYGQTVIERYPDSDIAERFRRLAKDIVQDSDLTIPKPLSLKELSDFAKVIREETKKELTGGGM
ncbi:nitrogenase iron protein [Desulfothermus naphthae]